ncbi:hypothetical protein [Marinobacter zhanjiangensis]|uniref:hypothetical protein n=1 Tax=Marinobacter zhanjiangensis TaxID=578215 RepID=UPI00167BC27C|nr:hypothetical protein [Marinobacter zhanjiangensis]
MKTTKYFDSMRKRPDRAAIHMDWVAETVRKPQYTERQEDGRIRLWRAIPQAQSRYLRVILLEDGETVHNAFFDRRFRP